MADEFAPIQLGEVAAVRSGFAFKSSDWTESGVPVVKIANVKDGRLEMDGCSFVLQRTADHARDSKLHAGDILIAMTGYIGDVAMVRDENLPVLLNQRVGRFVVRDQRRLDSHFLFYLLRNPEVRQEIEGLGYGSAQPNVSPTLIHGVKIPLPPLPEQRAIAHILGTLDDRIEANRRMAATLEETARALFRAWFVTFEPVRAKAEGRWRPGQTLPGLPASLYDLFPDHLVETEHGEAPGGWMEAKIGSVLERLKVGKLYDQKSALSTGLVPILDQGKRGSIGFHNDEPNIHADPENRVCTFANHTCVLRLIDYSFSTIQNVIPFRGTAVPTEWIYYASEGKQQFEEYRGHWPSFVEQKIIVPPPQLASVFRDVVDPIVTRIAQNELHSRAIATIRDTLLPGLVSGKIRVKDADAFLKVRGL